MEIDINKVEDFWGLIEELNNLATNDLLCAIDQTTKYINLQLPINQQIHLYIARFVFIREYSGAGIALDSLEGLFHNSAKVPLDQTLIQIISEATQELFSIPVFLRKYLYSAVSSQEFTSELVRNQLSTWINENKSQKYKFPYRKHLQLELVDARQTLATDFLIKPTVRLVDGLKKISVNGSEYSNISITTNRGLSISTAKNALVTGGSSVVILSRNKSAICEHLETSHSFHTKLTSDSIYHSQKGSQLIVAKVRGENIPTFDFAINLCGASEAHFGHFMMHGLQKTKAFTERKLPSDTKILIDELLAKSCVEYLETIFDANQIIYLPVGKQVKVKKLFNVQTSSFFPPDIKKPSTVTPEIASLDKSFFEYIATLGNKIIPDVNNRVREKIFISREGSSWGKLSNFVQVHEFFKARGFRIVKPEELTLAQQIKLFRDASVIVGLPGSALINLSHSKPGTKVYVIGGNRTFNWQTFLVPLSETGVESVWIDSCEESSPSSGHPHLSINIDQLKSITNENPDFSLLS